MSQTQDDSLQTSARNSQAKPNKPPISGRAVALIWFAAAVLGYIGLGGLLQETIEGIAPHPVPQSLSGLAAIFTLVAIIATVRWARRLRDPLAAAEAGAEDQPLASNRRRFLSGGAALTGGVLGVSAATVGRVQGWARTTGPALSPQTVKTDPNPRSVWQGAQINQYRPLGKTGLMVSDISIGSTRLHNHPNPNQFLGELLDRGVNYIDASPDYAPESERIIKAAISGRDRSKLVIASKFCVADGHLRQGSKVTDYISAIEGALERMGTEYLDVAHVHSCDSVDRLLDPNLHEAVARLRDQGKLKFLGVSTHTPNLEAVADAAIDSDQFDVMMLAYHHGAWPRQVHIIDRAAAKGMGIIAMKTLKGAKHQGLADFRPEADSYTQAAFKWVLNNPNVSNLVISFSEQPQIDEYLYASGQTLGARDLAVLEKYDQLVQGTHCFQHCGACLDSCPSAVPIHDVLRHRMYFEDYGDQKQAMQLYSRLAVNAAACIGCSAPCAGACPEGIDIHKRTVGAHQKLTLA